MADAPELLKVETPSVTQEGGVEVSPQTGVENREQLEAREAVPEQQIEQTPEEAQREKELIKQAEQLAPTVKPEPTVVKDPVVVDLEDLLAEDLDEIYVGLPDDRKPAFKQKGEEVAVAIKTMIDSGKVQARKILDLIRGWLKLVPGINKFFLEQEAKIKTDKIVDYVEANTGKDSDQNQI